VHQLAIGRLAPWVERDLTARRVGGGAVARCCLVQVSQALQNAQHQQEQPLTREQQPLLEGLAALQPKAGQELASAAGARTKLPARWR